MTITFYTTPHSTATITDAVIRDLGISVERVNVDLSKKENRTEKYLAINPNGKVPTIVHNGVSIWESAAITMYLGELYGVEKGLYPSGGSTKRGEAMKWIVWANVSLANAVSLHMLASRGQAGDAKDRAQDVHDLLKVLDKELGQSGGPFILKKFSIVDTHVFSIVDWTIMTNIELYTHENLYAWYLKCKSRSKAEDDEQVAN